MAESTSKNEKKICCVCNATSDEKVILQAEEKGKEVGVCVHCLPMLIHGAH
ncbi:MAG: hypothetical protein U1D67_06665 [Dehalococcoidia bacterium]|nr:hypothetical protein [Dehalococcoidia bacterium]MDZ4246781.1 hypothetical protein [Dehalococcoidia bacterium]